MCKRSSLEKNARQHRTNWAPTLTHSRSMRVLRVDLEQGEGASEVTKWYE